MTAIAAATALMATPVLAQSIEGQRAPAQVEQDAEQFGGNGGGVIIALLALAAIVAGIIIAVGGDDDVDLPTSP
ncbi:hypothetical protein [Aurantiacibacter arachoides]|nr:hypothetical protein [Aurantiacibacter arachoides]